jgi:hypothetical protein
MTYYSQVLRQRPLASWPLKETSYTVAEDISGNNVDATYSGLFAKGLPLVSNGESGVIFLDNTSEIEYPISSLMTSRKEYKSFSIELSFLINCDDRSLTNPILLFGQDFSGDFQGIYLQDNYIYFKPSYTKNYFVKYQVNNWNQKFHLVVSYNQAQIIMYVNGQQVDIKNAAEYVNNMSSFLPEINSFVSKGSNNYTYVLDSVSVYQFQISGTDILNHYLESNLASNYNLYLSTLAKPYYNFSIENQINGFSSSLEDFLPTEKFVKTNKYITLPRIDQQYVNGSNSFATIAGRDCLYLDSSYFEIDEILQSQNKIYKSLGISFYLDTTEIKSNNTLLYAIAENAVIEAYITDNDTLNININGASTAVELTTGWHDILFSSDDNCLVYVDGVEKIAEDFYIGNYNYILVGSSFNQTDFFDGYVSYLSLSSTLPLDYLNYDREAELYLKLTEDMHWSQNVSHEFSVYIPEVIGLDNTHAVSKYTSPNINITYNSGNVFPRNGALPELYGGVQTEEIFNINVNMTTNNSEDDLPELYEFYINGFMDYGKNIISNINGVSAMPITVDEIKLGKSLNSFIYKSSDIGAIIDNTSLEIPGLLNETKTISLMARLLNWDESERVLLDSDITDGPKIWWDGISWQTRGIDTIFFNGGNAIDEDSISSHYFYLTITLDDLVTSSDKLILGPNTHALILVQNENIETLSEIEEQYLVLNGISLSPLRSSSEPIEVTDKGLSVYNFLWETV